MVELRKGSSIDSHISESWRTAEQLLNILLLSAFEFMKFIETWLLNKARWRRNRVGRGGEEGVETEEGGEGDSEGKLVVFQGGEHLTLGEVLNATGQVVEKASYCTVYKAKLADGGGNIELRLLREGSCKFQGGEHLTLGEVLNATGQVVEKASYCTVYKAKLADGGGNIELRLLREGSCKDAASCGPAVRRIGRARHENLVPLRAFYQGRRGEKLLVYDYFPHQTRHSLPHTGVSTFSRRTVAHVKGGAQPQSHFAR
ncbi:hypothetical protein TRIUR3_25372 [Triticum urartu]|uniref:Protein kinase domain-containing protein n=1 Tax=Triticum urartu TaxID=4572 RepID=M8B377_TRIUA|nr:hypothetical protein TRIUR3_25372 [Triticum urartu]